MQWLIVTLKEMKDNLRDKRAFFFAVVYGPVIMPALMLLPMLFSAKEHMIDYEKTTDIMVVGAETAPNLVAHLESNNLHAVNAPDNFKYQIEQGQLEAVLEIGDNYDERMREGKPALLTLYLNRSRKDSQKTARHIRSIVDAYSRQLNYWRLSARGIPNEITQPIKVLEEDLSSEGLSGMVFGFFTYFIIVFTMMTGGFYLAVDISAGERERHSLEPLLALPISRANIVFGKYLAILCFVTFSSFLATLVMYLLLTLLPFDDILSFINLNGSTLVSAFLLSIPCCFLVSSLLMATAAFTKSAKEAQTYISILYILPMVPMLLNQFMDIKTTAVVMLIPFFSQFTLIDKTIKNESFEMAHVLASAGGSLFLAALLVLLAIWLYRQEKILGDV